MPKAGVKWKKIVTLDFSVLSTSLEPLIYLPFTLQSNIKKGPKEQNKDLKIDPIATKNKPRKDPKGL